MVNGLLINYRWYNVIEGSQQQPQPQQQKTDHFNGNLNIFFIFVPHTELINSHKINIIEQQQKKKHTQTYHGIENKNYSWYLVLSIWSNSTFSYASEKPNIAEWL